MRKVTLLGLIFLCVLFINAKNVFAKENTYKVSIEPVVERIHLEQNKEVEKKFVIKNENAAKIKIKVYAAPYSTDGNNHKISFESENKFTKIHEWINFKGSNGAYEKTQTYDLDANKSLEINYRIVTPAEVTTGGQYAVIFAETILANESEGIKNPSRVALKIQGIFDNIKKFSADIGEIKASGFLLGNQLHISTDIKNTGNIDFSTSALVSLSSLSNETIFEKKYASTVYPETTKNLAYTIGETPKFGIYKLRAVVSAAGMQKEINKTVVILPPYVLVISIVACIIIFCIIYRRIKLKHMRNMRKKQKRT